MMEEKIIAKALSYILANYEWGSFFILFYFFFKKQKLVINKSVVGLLQTATNLLYSRIKSNRFKDLSKHPVFFEVEFMMVHHQFDSIRDFNQKLGMAVLYIHYVVVYAEFKRYLEGWTQEGYSREELTNQYFLEQQKAGDKAQLLIEEYFNVEIREAYSKIRNEKVQLFTPVYQALMMRKEYPVKENISDCLDVLAGILRANHTMVLNDFGKMNGTLSKFERKFNIHKAGINAFIEKKRKDK